jgi:hypothetical protein
MRDTTPEETGSLDLSRKMAIKKGGRMKTVLLSRGKIVVWRVLVTVICQFDAAMPPLFRYVLPLTLTVKKLRLAAGRWQY